MAKKIIRVCLAQLNMTVGDLTGNVEKINGSIKAATNKNADIICFPELGVTGYPPEDLLLRSKFIEDNLNGLQKIIEKTGEIVAVTGFVNKSNKIYNSAAIINNGKIHHIYNKICLPNYGVFDEARYFAPGKNLNKMSIKNISTSVTICEDLWFSDGPVKRLAGEGVKLLININASPYNMGKKQERQDILTKQAKENDLTIVYLNLVGGQDELVFDGHSQIFGSDGEIIASLPQFKEELGFFDLEIEATASGQKVSLPPEREKIELKPTVSPILKEEAEVYTALKLGLKDYIDKNNFKDVIIGTSGGIDSALTAAIAVDALGPDRVKTVSMPSQYTSAESNEDSGKLANNLKVETINIPIDKIFQGYLESLKEPFKEAEPDQTEENIQARIRGNILMALSNKFNYIVLATGNKSELSVGYATLYGDMAGGFSVLKDVYKTEVYKLAKYRNTLSKVIPERIITKAPSAELRPNQLDTDSLPPYEVLDPILKLYIEEDKSPGRIVKSGYDEKVVKDIVKMVDSNEYKRRQAAPGIKITPKAFGRDRRMPITNKY